MVRQTVFHAEIVTKTGGKDNPQGETFDFRPDLQYTRLMRNKSILIRLAALLLAVAFIGIPRFSEAAELSTAQKGTMTGQCTVAFPEKLSGKEYRVTDGMVESYQTFSKGDVIRIQFPSAAEGLYLEWYEETGAYSVTYLDGAGSPIQTDGGSGYLNAYFPAPDGASGAEISIGAKNVSLSTISVYEKGKLPDTVQKWTALDKADILIAASTPERALFDFYSAVAVYGVCFQVPVQLVIMTRTTRTAQNELLAALWNTGYGFYPKFGSFKAENNEFYKMVRAGWGKKQPLTYLKEQITAYAPRILLTHPAQDQAPDGAAQYTGEKAIEAASKTVEKVYTVSAGGGTVIPTDEPMAGLGGRTVRQAGEDAYALCQQIRQYMPKFPVHAEYLLQKSSVGKDSGAGDLLENIDTASLRAYEPVTANVAVRKTGAEPLAAGAGAADSSYYRSASDPEEVILEDYDGGHWEYRTDTLSILVDRHETTYVSNAGKEFPLVYFVAHIRMRGINAFRTCQAADNRNGMGAIKPWILARRNKAVLMITGDNLVESDEQYKSILVRDGKVFLNNSKCDSMAIYPDLTMRIFGPYDTKAEELLMDGVRDVFSFGPTFIRDGVFTDADIDNAPRIHNETNPRTGIGMVEPGHFVAIVVDGRQKEYSYGMRLTTFGEMFVAEGCTQAYNLDGGVSACMLFMGEQLNHHGNNRVGTVEDTYQRRIPDGLVFGYSDRVPSEDDPLYHKGEG